MKIKAENGERNFLVINAPISAATFAFSRATTVCRADLEYEDAGIFCPWRNLPSIGYTALRNGPCRALVQLMRWSGVAIRDAVTLRRDEIVFDKAKALHRIVTSRQKTGTHVSVPIPKPVAKELLAALNGNPDYVFWTGQGTETTCVSHWQEDFCKLFKAAGIIARGNMLSHRLWDTFAVDLLEKGVPLEEVSRLLGHESIIHQDHGAALIPHG